MCIFNVYSLFFILVPVVVVVAVVAGLVIALLLYYSKFLLKHNHSSPFLCLSTGIRDLVSDVNPHSFTVVWCLE